MATADEPRLQRRRLVAVVAHPDDEAWALGGTLARCARDGTNVRVICATGGEGGHVLRDGQRTRANTDLAGLRAVELLASCEALGIGAPVMLGWPDGGVAGLPTWSAVQDLRAAIAELAPEVVLGIGLDGGYAHVDHTALARLLREAITSMTTHSQPRLLEQVFAPGLFDGVRKSLRRVRPDVIDAAVTTLGVPWTEQHLVVDVRSVATAKLAAIGCHVSQLPPRGVDAFLGGVVPRLLDQERFMHVHGRALPKGATDPFD